MANYGDELIVGEELGRALPSTPSGLVFPPAMDFGADATDLRSGPLGPARPLDPRRIAQPIPQIPRFRPYRFGTLLFHGATSTPVPTRITIDGPTVVCVFDWEIGDPGNGNGLPILMYGPADGANPPDFEDADPSANPAWLSGWGPVAFLPAAGDWWLVTSFGVLAVDVTSQFMLIDAQSPAIANAWCRDFSRRPNQHDGAANDGAGGGGLADFTIAAATATRIVNDNSFLRTAITVQNTGGGSLRVDFANGSADIAAGTRGYSVPGTASGSPILKFEGPTLLEGDLWAYSVGGTTIQVRVYGQTNWKNNTP